MPRTRRTPPPPAPTAAPYRSSYTASTYTGPELAPYTGRPGAMRAYALPSLVAGQHLPRKPPICSPSGKF